VFFTIEILYDAGHRLIPAISCKYADRSFFSSLNKVIIIIIVSEDVADWLRSDYQLSVKRFDPRCGYFVYGLLEIYGKNCTYCIYL
jgi:hypothetical protein